MKMFMLSGMLCAAAMTLCSMSGEGMEAGDAGGGTPTPDDASALAEYEGAQQNDTDGAVEEDEGVDDEGTAESDPETAPDDQDSTVE